LGLDFLVSSRLLGLTLRFRCSLRRQLNKARLIFCNTPRFLDFSKSPAFLSTNFSRLGYRFTFRRARQHRRIIWRRLGAKLLKHRFLGRRSSLGTVSKLTTLEATHKTSSLLKFGLSDRI